MPVTHTANGLVQYEYASFWRRLIAFAIDYVLQIIAGMIIVLIITLILEIFFPNQYSTFQNTLNEFNDYLLGYIIYVTYSVICLGIGSTTPGKRIVGMMVLTEDYKKLDWQTALIRSLIQPLSTILFGYGYWRMFKNEKKQAWHDQVAQTIVVLTKK